jgi:hypothetical protein
MGIYRHPQPPLLSDHPLNSQSGSQRKKASLIGLEFCQEPSDALLPLLSTPGADRCRLFLACYKSKSATLWVCILILIRVHPEPEKQSRDRDKTFLPKVQPRGCNQLFSGLAAALYMAGWAAVLWIAVSLVAFFIHGRWYLPLTADLGY